MSSSATSGENVSSLASACGPSCATSTAWPRSTSASASAVGGVLVVVDDQHAAARRSPAADPRHHRDRARRARRTPSTAAGSGTTNSLPLPDAVAVRLDGAAVQRDQRLDDAEPEAEPAFRAVQPLPPLHEQVEHAPAASRRGCRCRVSLTATRSRSSDGDGARLALTAIDRRTPCTWRRWSAGSRTPARAAVLSPSTVSPVSTSTVRWCMRCSSSGLASSIACPITSPRSTIERSSEILPRAMRDTSSRSSTRRTTCRTCRSMSARSCSKMLLPRSCITCKRRQDRRQRVAQLVAEHRQELVLGARRLLGRGARLFGGSPLPAHLELRLDARDQLARRERLDQVVVRARVQPFDARLVAGARRQHDDRDRRQLRRSAADAPHQLEAVQRRHHHVGQDQVRRAALGRRQRRLAVADRLDLPAVARGSAGRSRACRRCRRPAGCARAVRRLAGVRRARQHGATASRRPRSSVGQPAQRLLDVRRRPPSTSTAAPARRRRARRAGARCRAGSTP